MKTKRQNELKIFEIRFAVIDEKEWVAAHTNIEALATYQSITDHNLWDFEEGDEVVELPKKEWKKHSVRFEDEPEKTMTFFEWMQQNDKPDIIAGTMYEF